MADSITTRVLDALATAGLLTVEQISSVTSAAQTSGGTPGDVLIQRGMITPADVETVMEDELGIPRVDLSSYAPDDEALRIIPIEMATERNILPLFEIEGMLTVAIGDPMDVFKLDALAADLGLEIEAVLSDAASVRGAVVQYYTEAGLSVSAPIAAPTAESILAEEPTIDAADFFEAPVADDGPIVAESPFTDEAKTARVEPTQTIADVVETAAPEGPPAIDLDVLAVADTRKVALLVSEILEHAVAKGANRIQLLPYKDDFFLVYRIHGRLEKIASAPLSMQGALVDGFKNFAKLSSVESSRPALGRLKAHISDRSLVVIVSAVPTIAGQRVVISLAADKPAPRGLDELGMNEAEQRALQVMVERGRGILLVCAPVAGGRSSTYYALLNHAAHIGKTVYSVERAIEYEIPAVAQVLVSPGSPVGAEGYFAAGIRQDTDVVAIDAMHSVEDMHLAVEAAGLGKLVIATFSGGDIVSGVRRMLDMGAEPVSLASALTLGVGQRLVRMNCPSCAAEKSSPLLAKIPGADKSVVTKAGAGCPACMNTGFQGATAIFEVLPFTEQVRAPIARGGSGAEIAEAARAAGMRSMIASGLVKVNEGLVSPEELNRVLRFA